MPDEPRQGQVHHREGQQKRDRQVQVVPAQTQVDAAGVTRGRVLTQVVAGKSGRVLHLSVSDRATAASDRSGPAKKEYNTEIIDSEGQSSYEYNQFIYGKYNKRAELQVVYKKYLVSNSIFRGVDRLKLMMGIMEGDFKQQGCSQ